MRLIARAKGGFYPAPPEAVALAAGYIARMQYGMPTLLDPCCGKGTAIRQLAELIRCPPANVYAIELDEGRAAEANANLEGANVIGRASFFGVACSPNSMSLCWCNPPFDDELGGGNRTEQTFLQHATTLLRPGGVMILVCPEDVADSDYDDVAQTFKQWYDRIAIVPFPDGHRRFNEVMVFGVKRSSPISPYTVEWNPRRTGISSYTLPAGIKPRRWEKIEMTEAEISRAFAASPLRRFLEPPAEPTLPQPPLALGVGHIALLLAAGNLDGVVRPDDEPPHVVRGTADKVEYVASQDETENDDGSVTTKTVLAERIVLTVRAVGPDGDIRTFTS
jgi:SAM-dependent methyltransferase